MPANAFGAVLVALVDGLMLHHSVDPTGFRWENIRKVVDILLNQLAKAPDQARQDTGPSNRSPKNSAVRRTTGPDQRQRGR
jgi:hypothetical protein